MGGTGWVDRTVGGWAVGGWGMGGSLRGPVGLPWATAAGDRALRTYLRDGINLLR